MAGSESLRVFISYARRDCSAFAEELLAGLQVAGFDPFLDRHDIKAGEDWEARLGGLIQAADTVVFVISPAAVTSERCAWEVRKAEELSKRVIPVVAVEVTEAETPRGLRRLNYIFFSEGHSFARGLGELKTALQVDLNWIREHTRLGELAARWQQQNQAEALFLRGSELEAAKVWLTAWQAPAPSPTELHRAFIGESEATEIERHGVERQRLQEIAAAQVDREHALERVRRGTLVAGALVAVLFLATVGGGILLLQANQRAELMRASLNERDASLNAVQAQLESVANELEASRLEIASSESERDAQARQLESLRATLGRSETLLSQARRDSARGGSAVAGRAVAGRTVASTPAASPTCRTVTEIAYQGGQEVRANVVYCRNAQGEWQRED